MYYTHVREFLTRKYRPGWSHLEKTEYVCTAKVLGGKTLREPEDEDFDDGGTYGFTVVLPAGRHGSRRKMARILAEHFSGSRCQHEHDCCGCLTKRATATPTRRYREYFIAVSFSYNY